MKHSSSVCSEEKCSSSCKRRCYVHSMSGTTPLGMSQSRQPKENPKNNKNNLEATNGVDEDTPNGERPPCRKGEKVTRKRGDSDSNPFSEELKK
jgi:hypothetical protein